MSVKVCKKAFLALAVVMLLGSIALPAPAASPLIGTQEEPPEEAPAASPVLPPASPLVTGRAEDSEFTQVISGGIEVTYTGLWKHGNTFEASFKIVSSRARRVAIEADNSQLVDANDVKILPVISTDSRSWFFGESLSVGVDVWDAV